MHSFSRTYRSLVIPLLLFPYPYYSEEKKKNTSKYESKNDSDFNWHFLENPEHGKELSKL